MLQYPMSTASVVSSSPEIHTGKCEDSENHWRGWCFMTAQKRTIGCPRILHVNWNLFSNYLPRFSVWWKSIWHVLRNFDREKSGVIPVMRMWLLSTTWRESKNKEHGDRVSLDLAENYLINFFKLIHCLGLLQTEPLYTICKRYTSLFS